MAVTTRLKKVTVIAERVLRDDVLALLKRHHASGWTLTEVTGEGSRGMRASEWEGSNVKIHSLVSPAKAEAIMEDIAAQFFADWSLVVYASDVEVLRGEKYLDAE